MIIPVRCFTCGKVISNKYNYYQRRVAELKKEMSIPAGQDMYINVDDPRDSPEKKVLDELGLKR